MGFSRFRAGVVLRAALLFLTLLALAEMLARTRWHISIALCSILALSEVALLIRFAAQSSREVARFLEAVSLDDTSQSFSGLMADRVHRELGAAMSRVMDLLRIGRAEREAEVRYLQTLIAHVPVALICLEESGRVQLLNMAARRLFETSLTHASQFIRFGEPFEVGVNSLRPGGSAILRMERTSRR